jgi:hypothetical protein
MDEDHEEQLTKEPEVFEEYPFLQSFPFQEYLMHLDRDEDYGTASGIDPVIISAAGGFAKPEFINFQYQGKYTKVMLSFYTYDITYVSDQSKKIKKLDSVRELLDRGLESRVLLEKIDCIKKGERFLKKLGSSLSVGKAFDNVLDQFLLAEEYELSKTELRKIKSMFKTIDEDEYNDEVKGIIRSFYNIHLHHIKILLGVVIAAKIH